MCLSFFFDKVAGWSLATLSNTGSSTGVSPWIFQHFEQHVSKNTYGRLLLKNEQL